MRQRQMSQVPDRAWHHAVRRGADRVWTDFRVSELHRGGKEFELMERAMGFAALAMLTVFPLLIVVAAAGAATHHGVAVWVVYGMGLNGSSARAVTQLFSAPTKVLSTTSAFSLALTAVFGVSFAGSVQGGFERIWSLPSGSWHKIWRQLVWLTVFIAYIYAAATVGAATRHTPAQTVSRVLVATVLGLVFFWWGVRFLLGGRVSYLAAMPGAVATLAFLAGLRVFSTLVFEPLVVTNAVTYGALGTVLVVQSWLIGVGWVVYGGQLFGRWFHDAWLRSWVEKRWGRRSGRDEIADKLVESPCLHQNGIVADELITDAGDLTQVPPPYDTTVAHPARVYNYWLGGKDNFEADREVGEQTKAAYPDIVSGVRAQRAFLASAVRYLVTRAGVRQFLDIGTGLPVADNTHEVAQSLAPESRIVYADNDPMVLAHARALLASTPEGACAYLDADLRDTGKVLRAASGLLDFGQPVAVMLIGILHLIPDADDPAGIVARLIGALPAGSWLAIAHPASDVAPDKVAAMTDRYNKRVTTTATLRTHAEIEAFFAGTDLLPPGVVQYHQWNPGEPAGDAEGEIAAYCGLGRKS